MISSNGFNVTLIFLINGGYVGLSSLLVSKLWYASNVYILSPTIFPNIVCFLLRCCAYANVIKNCELFISLPVLAIASIPLLLNFSLWWN